MDPISIVLLVVFGIIALLLTGLTLLQEEQGEGLGGIFGGGSNNQVGNRKGNILTKATSILGFLFLAVCFIFALTYRQTTSTADLEALVDPELRSAPVQAEEWWQNTVPAPLEAGTPDNLSIDAFEAPASEASDGGDNQGATATGSTGNDQ
jgi:preprotein translocase subunit SecG